MRTFSPSDRTPPDARAVLWVVIGATFVTVLDSSLVSTALPRIGHDLHATGTTHWVVTAYLLSASIAMTSGPWLSDRWGRRRAFLSGLGLFTLGAAASAAAPSAGILFAARSLQGIGTGVIVPVGMALIFSVHTGEARTRALATWGLAAVIAPAAGPFVGGVLASALGWRPLFVLELPLTAVSMVAAHRLVTDDGTRTKRPLDVTGLIFGGGGLALCLVTLSESSTGAWSGGLTATGTLCGLALLALFVRRALTTPAPLLRVRVLGDRQFGITMIVVCLLSAAQYARLVLVPVAVEAAGGSPRTAGLAVGALALGTAPAMLLTGRVTRRFGARPVIVTGTALAAVTSAPLCVIDSANSDPALLCLFLLGVALGMSIVPATVAGLDGLGAELLSDASAWRGLSRQLSGAVGVAAVSAIFVWRAGSLDIASSAPAFADAYRDCCVFLLALALCAAVTAPALSRRPGPAAVPEPAMAQVTSDSSRLLPPRSRRRTGPVATSPAQCQRHRSDGP